MPLWIVGLLIGGESFIQMLLDVPAGHLVDRFGKKRMLTIGWFAFIASAILLMQFSLATYIASIVLSVFGWLFFAPGTDAYVLAYAEKTTSGRFLSLKDTFAAVGIVFASIALPIVLFYDPFYMGAILLVFFSIAIIALKMSPPDKPSPHTEAVLPAEPYHIRRTHFLKSLKALKRLNPASGMLCLSSFASAIFYGAIWFIVPLVIAADVNQKLLGLGLGIFDLSIVMLGVLIGTIVDRSNKRLLVFYGLLVFAIMGMLIGMTLGPLFLLFGFLATAGDETANLSLWSWLHSLDREHSHDGAIAGAISFSGDFGYAIGPVAAGFMFSALGPAWAITLCSLPIFLVWITYVVYVRPRALFPSSLLDIPRMPMRRRHKS